MLVKSLIRSLIIGQLLYVSPIFGKLSQFTEGEHFKKISLTNTKNLEVQQSSAEFKNPSLPNIMIFFNYGCYGCWIMNKHFNDWTKKNPNKVNISYYPVAFNDMWNKLAKLYYVNKELNVYTDEEVFYQIHGEPHKALWIESEMIDFYAKKNISKERILELFHSFDIERKIKNSLQLVKVFNINLTPDVIIQFKNNSYLVNLTMVPDLKNLFEVIEYLISHNK